MHRVSGGADARLTGTRGDIVHRVYGVRRGRADDAFFGALRTAVEATARIRELEARDGGTWAGRYRDEGSVVRPFAVDTDVEIPALPKPRDHDVVRTTRTVRFDVEMEHDLASGAARDWTRTRVSNLE